MVDTLASGASGGNPVEVQVLSSAPLNLSLISVLNLKHQQELTGIKTGIFRKTFSRSEFPRQSYKFLTRILLLAVKSADHNIRDNPAANKDNTPQQNQEGATNKGLVGNVFALGTNVRNRTLQLL